MKNYLNYIKESAEQEDLIRVCIEKEVFKPITLIKDINIKDYLEENFTKFKPSSIKACMKYFNLNIEKINEIYSILDIIFSNLEIKLYDNYPDSIFYKFNNDVVAEYNKISETFYYYINNIILNNLIKYDFEINNVVKYFSDKYLKISDAITRSVIKSELYRGRAL